MKNLKVLLRVVVLLLLVLIVFKCSQQDKDLNRTSIDDQTRVLTPPIPELDIPYHHYTVNPSEASVISTPSGAEIVVPENAFLDSDGNIVTENVEISYRDFYHPLEFYLAGIPMTFNQDGVDQVFESAGMIEITASADGQPLFTNPNSKISVDLMSWSKSTEFNLYDLDPETGQWIDRGKDSISVINKESELMGLPPIPAMPKVTTPYSFKIKDDTNNFPEISDYEHVFFEPLDYNNCNLTNATEMKVNLLQNGVFEVITIIDAYGIRQENRCLCYLAFEEGVEYYNALKIYQDKYADLLNNRKAVLADINAQWDFYYDVINTHRKAQIRNMDGEEKILRTLTVNNFGFINCDFPRDYPQGGILYATFVDQDNNPLSFNEVVLIQENSNTLFRYQKEIKYDPNKENVLWGITRDQVMGYLTKEDFLSIESSKKAQTITMRTINTKGLLYEDLMEVLFE